MSKMATTIFLSAFCLRALADGYYLVDEGAAESILNQCSRDVPVAESFWTPTKTQIAELEERLKRLKDLASDRCCNYGKIEGSPRDYPRQYAGVVVRGKKLIYINAGVPATKEVTMVCDGGKSYWGVLYDPETKTFSELAFNGEA